MYSLKNILSNYISIKLTQAKNSIIKLISSFKRKYLICLRKRHAKNSKYHYASFGEQRTWPLRGKQQILSSHMQSIPMTTFTCFLTSTYLSLPISFHWSKIHIPPPWPITGMHFYMENHFCVLQVCLKHLGLRHYCQLSVVWKLLCKLASFTPPIEDLQDLTQEGGSAGLQPSFPWVYDTTVQ